MEKIEPHFADADPDELIQYHALSPMAIASLILGILAGIGLLWVPMALIGLGAVIAALLALRAIGDGSSGLVGRRLALSGLLLGIFFLVAAPVHRVMHGYFLCGQAREVADGWFAELKRGSLTNAHRMTIAPSRREKSHAMISNYYQTTRENKFYNRPTVRLLVEGAPDGELRFKETLFYIGDHDKEFVHLGYVLHTTIDDQPVEEEIKIVMERNRYPKAGEGAWRIHAILPVHEKVRTIRERLGV